MNVDAVEDGTEDAFLVFGNYGKRTCAGFLCVTLVAAGAGVYTIGIFSGLIMSNNFVF
jgi:hypothetical protein